MKKKIFKVFKIILLILLFLIALIALYLYSLMDKINHEDFSKVSAIEEFDDNSTNIDNDSIDDIDVVNKVSDEKEDNIIYSKLEQVDSNDVDWNIPELQEKNDNIVNVLLLGVEAIGGGKGRTDAMMIATINESEKSLKLTSLMRDIYVQIPGYKSNKLNSVYGRGGVSLLVETIEQNFGVPIDGTFLVNFDSFEKIIDVVGGVEIELTQREANYLNSTNYVSEEKNRNLNAGINHLNGNQALGYVRVRKISGLYGHSDFGRTGRQRAVLESLFNTYKNKDILELFLMAEEILPLITTDFNKFKILKLLNLAIDLKFDKVEQLRIPIDKHYKSTTVNGAYMLVPDWEINLEALHNFIYGEKKNN